MAKKLEVREGDMLTIRVPVRVTSENALGDQIVTVELMGQRITGQIKYVDVVEVEKGSNWPETD